MTRVGIPTEYRGIRFRSRLEARWAAFFDLCSFKWHYEPFDLLGWIPDFSIETADPKQPILVEVKPITAFCEKTAAKIYCSCVNSLPHLDVKPFVLLLVGAHLLDLEHPWLKAIGWYASPNWLGAPITTDKALRLDQWPISYLLSLDIFNESAAKMLGQDATRCVTLAGVRNSGVDHIYGENMNISAISYESRSLVEALWAEAGNRVQWRRAP